MSDLGGRVGGVVASCRDGDGGRMPVTEAAPATPALAALLEARRTGAPRDRDRTIELLMPVVRRVARAVHGPRRGAGAWSLDELVSEGSVSLVRAVETYEPERGRVGDVEGYVAWRVKCDLIAAIRRDCRGVRGVVQVRYSGLEVPEGDGREDASLEAVGQADGLSRLLRDLDAVTAEAVRLKVVEQRRYSDVAEVLGVSEHEARRLVAAGLSSLRASHGAERPAPEERHARKARRRAARWASCWPEGPAVVVQVRWVFGASEAEESEWARRQEEQERERKREAARRRRARRSGLRLECSCDSGLVCLL